MVNRSMTIARLNLRQFALFPRARSVLVLQAVRGLLPVMFLLPMIACAQAPAFQVDDVVFARQTEAVPDGQKESTAGDLDGDGHPDILIAVDDGVTILRGDGTGSLGAPIRVPAGPNPVGLAIADLNADGHLDIAVANHESYLLTLLRGDGTGGAQPFSHSPVTVDVAPHPHAVRAADLDGDGNADLIVDHRENGGLLVLLGAGDGTFESAGTVLDAGGDPYRGMAVGDLNADGRPDMVTPNPNAVGVLLNTSSNPLTFSRSMIATEGGPFAVALGDLNADGHQDIVAALDEGSSLVQVFLGDGQGDFREAGDSPIRWAAGAKMIARGDFNGDGVDDAAIVCWNATEVLLVLGDADGLRTATLPVAANAWGPAAADLNADGIDDLVVPDAASARVAIFVSQVE